MNRRIKMLLIMTLFACISGGVLSLVYLFSAPLIEANMLEEEKRSIFNVVPGIDSYEEKSAGELKYFECKDASGKVVGYALPAQGNGYQGVIKLMVGLTTDLSEITGISVLEQVETPGLGGRIGETVFQEQFRGVKTEPAVGYVKNQAPDKDTDIQAVTGATISSRSVVTIVNRNISKFRDIL
jgi:electron transport complex protein RnfG